MIEPNGSPVESPLSMKPRVYADLITDPIESGVFLLHPNKPFWAFANESALNFLPQLNGTNTLREAARNLQKYWPDVSIATLENDLCSFTDELWRAHLLENIPGPNLNVTSKSSIPDLTLYITEECNLRCKHCFVVEGRMPKPLLTKAKIQSLILEHLERYPNAQISFTGGEPFLRDDCMELIRFARNHSPRIAVNTNGILVTPEIARELSELQIQIQVSLESADPKMHDWLRGKGTFEKAWACLQLMNSAGGIKTTLTSTTLTKCSLSDVENMIFKASELGVATARFLMLTKMRASKTHWEEIKPEPDELKKIYRSILVGEYSGTVGQTKIQCEMPGFVPDPSPEADHWCPMSKTTLIDSQAKAYACPGLLIDEYQVGDTQKQSLKEIQESHRYRGLRDIMKRRHMVIPECQTCAWRNFCQGGCQAVMQMKSDSIYTTDEFCDFRRDLYREVLQKRALSS